MLPELDAMAEAAKVWVLDEAISADRADECVQKVALPQSSWTMSF